MIKFAIVQHGEYGDVNVLHEFSNKSRASAIDGFRTLYGYQQSYALYQQVAASEPAGSRDEANDASGEDSLQSPFYENDLPF